MSDFHVLICNIPFALLLPILTLTLASAQWTVKKLSKVACSGKGGTNNDTLVHTKITIGKEGEHGTLTFG